MARIINGQPADNPEEKKKAVESMGGKYFQYIVGDYVEGRKTNTNQKNSQSNQPQPKTGYQDKPGDGNKTPGTGNYTENLDGEYIPVDVIE